MDSMMAHRLTAEGYEREKEKENNCYRDTKKIEEREENRTGEEGTGEKRIGQERRENKRKQTSRLSRSHRTNTAFPQ